MPKGVVWVDSSKDDLSAFPQEAKDDAGHQLFLVEQDLEPTDWKPMKTVGIGVREIRSTAADAEYRFFYIVIGEVIYVLHAFQKKTQQTAKREITLAKRRLAALKKTLAKEAKRAKNLGNGKKRETN